MNSIFNGEVRKDDSDERIEDVQFPGTSLQFGHSGKHVRMMQRYLNDIRRAFHPNLPRLEENGKFDNATAECVRDFQLLYNIEPDSAIGRSTWDSIVSEYRTIPFSSNYDLPLMNLPEQGLEEDLRFPGRELQFGCSGKHVRLMQEQLNAIRSVFYPQLPLLNADGHFGIRTAQCVRDFQLLSNLLPDSIIGRSTWDSIILKHGETGLDDYNNLRLSDSSAEGKREQKCRCNIQKVFKAIKELMNRLPLPRRF